MEGGKEMCILYRKARKFWLIGKENLPMKPKYRGSCPDIRPLAISAAVVCLFALAIAAPFITSCTSEEEPAAKAPKPVPAAPVEPPEPPKPPPKPAAPTHPVVEEPQEPEPEPVKPGIKCGNPFREETDKGPFMYTNVGHDQDVVVKAYIMFVFYDSTGKKEIRRKFVEAELPPGEMTKVSLPLKGIEPKGRYECYVFGTTEKPETPPATTPASPPTAPEAGGSARS